MLTIQTYRSPSPMARNERLYVRDFAGRITETWQVVSSKAVHKMIERMVKGKRVREKELSHYDVTFRQRGYEDVSEL